MTKQPENIRMGAPYDDPAFEALCREMSIWGTAQAALAAVFWRAGQYVLAESIGVGALPLKSPRQRGRAAPAKGADIPTLATPKPAQPIWITRAPPVSAQPDLRRTGVMFRNQRNQGVTK